MKRFSLIFLGALAILMAGCSKNEPQVPDEDAWVYDLSLPVPIRFGSGIPATKGEEGDPFSGQICLWGFDERYGASDDEASCPFNGENFIIADGVINTGQYYPMESTYNYSFYALSPVPDSGPNSNDEIRLDLTKNLDYIYASATAEGGYNARYVREHGQPKLQFRHLTASLSFKAVADVNPRYDETAFESVSIERVTIDNVHTSLYLKYAGQDAGTTRAGSSIDKNKVVFEGSANPTVDGTLLGGEHFLYSDNNKFTIKVKIKYDLNGEYVTHETTHETPIVIETGKKYVFNILVHHPEEMTLEIVAPEWENQEAFDIDTYPGN